jgi:hypothetical protein
VFRFLVLLVAVAAIAASALYIREDYLWADREIAAGVQGGWQVVYQQNIYSDPTYPWTLVATPVTALYFMNPDEIQRHGHQLFLAPVTAKTYDYTHRKTRQHLFWAGFDLENNRIAIFKADKDGLVVVQKEVTWIPIQADSPGEGLAAYVRKHQSTSYRQRAVYKTT